MSLIRMLQSQVEALSAMVDSLKEEKKRLHAQIDGLKKELERAQDDRAETTMRFRELIKERNDALEARMLNAGRADEGITEVKRQLAEEIKRNGVRLATRAKKVYEAQREAARLEKEVVELRKANARQGELLRTNGLVQIARKQRDAFEAKVWELEARIDKLSKRSTARMKGEVAADEKVARLKFALEGLAIQGLEDDHPTPCFCNPSIDRHPTEYCIRARSALRFVDES